jgi:hypothetical protein
MDDFPSQACARQEGGSIESGLFKMNLFKLNHGEVSFLWGLFTAGNFEARPLAGVRGRNAAWRPKRVPDRRGMAACARVTLGSESDYESTLTVLLNSEQHVRGHFEYLVSVTPKWRSMNRSGNLAAQTAAREYLCDRRLIFKARRSL